MKIKNSFQMNYKWNCNTSSEILSELTWNWMSILHFTLEIHLESILSFKVWLTTIGLDCLTICISRRIWQKIISWTYPKNIMQLKVHHLHFPCYHWPRDYSSTAPRQDKPITEEQVSGWWTLPKIWQVSDLPIWELEFRL